MIPDRLTQKPSDLNSSRVTPSRRQSGNIPSPVRNVGFPARSVSSKPSLRYGRTCEPIRRVRRLFDYAQAHRDNQTPAEYRLWSVLYQVETDWYREVVLGNYIVDFICKRYSVIVEVDGDSHLGKEGYDGKRHEWLTRKGFKVLYFTNRQVLTDLENVLKVINVTIAAIATRRNRQRQAMARRMLE